MNDGVTKTGTHDCMSVTSVLACSVRQVTETALCPCLSCQQTSGDSQLCPCSPVSAFSSNFTFARIHNKGCSRGGAADGLPLYDSCSSAFLLALLALSDLLPVPFVAHCRGICRRLQLLHLCSSPKESCCSTTSTVLAWRQTPV